MSGHSASLEQALQRLYRRTAHGLKLGLEATERLFDALHLPRGPFPIVHIAGTNGKGSTAAMLSAMLHQAGYRTGRFTSPHLLRFNERFTVNEESITDEDLEAILSRVESAAQAEDGQHPDRPLTFFEISTALAVQYFADREVDLAVVETGLGGRLDATNVLQPSLCVLTRIDLDHTAWLGETLEAVAGEKAGIMKPGVPVVLAEQKPEVLEFLLREAGRIGCPVLSASEIQIARVPGGQSRIELSSAAEQYGRMSPPLAGSFQLENLAAAVTAAEALAGLGFGALDRETIRKGLQQVVWPGRCQVLNEDPLTLLDCAHNPGGMAAFLEWAVQRAGQRPLGMIFSAVRDKDLHSLCKQVAGVSRRLWVCELDSPRTASLEELTGLFHALGVDVQAGSFREVRQETRDWQVETGGVIGIAGSVYLAGMELGGSRDAGELF